jgi:hypothetical protein
MENMFKVQKPGMIFNTVTKELFDGEKGIDVIPCHYKLEYVEWQERGEGGGAPVAIHSILLVISYVTNKKRRYLGKIDYLMVTILKRQPVIF